MKRGAFPAAVLALATAIAIASPFVPLATAQEGPSPQPAVPPTERRLPPHWIDQVFPNGIPTNLAVRFGRAALEAGLTPGQASRLLSDYRFVLAVGSPDQGWGLLKGMIRDPATIADAWVALQDGKGTLTTAGATSFQTAILGTSLELTNAYLKDLGLMIAPRSDGIEVLVDIETGRQAIGPGHLGAVVTAPGGGPLPTPSISPEDAAAAMWAAAGIDPNDPNPARTIMAAGPTGPGLSTPRERRPSGMMSPAIWLLGGSFLLAWFGYAAVMVTKRLRRD